MKIIAKNEKQKKSINEMTIEVAMPATARIELVQGNELRHYEIFSLLFSLSLSVAVGFWTGYVTTPKSLPLFWSALAFSFLTLVTGYITFYYRSKMYDGKINKTMTFDNFKGE